MSEHRIRLRGGWECHYHAEEDGEGAESSRRVDLPVVWPGDLPARVRLVRQFGKPPVDPRLEEVSLEMKGVPGLASARINGTPVTSSPAEPGSWSVALNDPLLPRNGLVLEVDMVSARADGGQWGEIWLSIRSR